MTMVKPDSTTRMCPTPEQDMASLKKHLPKKSLTGFIGRRKRK